MATPESEATIRELDAKLRQAEEIINFIDGFLKDGYWIALSDKKAPFHSVCHMDNLRLVPAEMVTVKP